jgi:hypothetical protein
MEISVHFLILLGLILQPQLAVSGCRKFQVDVLGDHLYTCTFHSMRNHDWVVDQLADLFRTTQKDKTHQVVKSRGQNCGDIELVGYLANVSGPVSLVLDLRVTHDRCGSSDDPALNGHLRYPNNLDQSLNDTVADKLRKYRPDYNFNPTRGVGFMSVIASTSGSRPDYNFNPTRGVGFMSVIPSTSGRLHSEFIRIFFLQAHRETDRFFAASGVLSSQSDRGFSTTPARLFLLYSNLGLEKFSSRLLLYVLTSTLTDRQSRLSLTLTLYTRKLLVF